jgi:hypothetical protein
MTAGFDRDLVPGWPEYAQQQGMRLDGRGTWRTTRCDVHGGSDSLRVNVESGGWACMNCLVRGGDTLSHYMQVNGSDFVSAARALGAWIEGASSPPRPRGLAARDALGALGVELLVCVAVIADARRGITPTDDDWRRFLAAAGRVEFIAREAVR